MLMENVSLKDKCTLKIGGYAKRYFEPVSVLELRDQLKMLKKDGVGYQVLGKGSNVLISSQGVSDCVISLCHSSFKTINSGLGFIKAGAGVLLKDLSQFALENNLKGFEFLAVIPGTVGGGVKGNIGRGSDVMDKLIKSIKMIDGDGNLKTCDVSEFEWSYRNSSMSNLSIIIEVEFWKEQGERESILSKRDLFKHQSLKEPKGLSVGSVFKNTSEMKAWEIIDQIGMRGFSVGDAYVSDIHCNWIINKGNATSKDFWTLIKTIQDKAYNEKRIQMELEIDCWGEFQA